MSFLRINVLITWLVAIFSLLSICPRNEPVRLIVLVVLAVLLLLLFFNKQPDIRSLIVVFVLIRLPFLFSDPLLSDDVFRFQWDADVVRQNISPYSFLPSDLLNQNGFSSELFFKLNSQEYYSVYPAVMQSLFQAAKLLPSLLEFVFRLKIIYFITELLLFIYIVFISRTKQWFVKKFYFLSLLPIVVLEGLGNLHFEVLMMYLFFCAFNFYQNKKALSGLKTGVILALSVFTKLTVLPLLVLFVEKSKRSIWLCFAFASTSILFFMPFIDQNSMRALESFELYFGSFEFNASLYFIVRYLGFEMVGYNIIETYGIVFKTVLVLFGVFILIQSILFDGKNQKRLMALLNAFFLLYCFANPTLHPWYIIVPLFLSAFTRSYFWIIWSVTIYFSYFFYIDNAQIGWWLYAEYGILFIALLVIKKLLPNKIRFFLTKGEIQ
tara:strand:- start:53661 stop:54974 length:1314 start_codon:yes stop_codon:yes gene_type:complete